MCAVLYVYVPVFECVPYGDIINFFYTFGTSSTYCLPYCLLIRKNIAEARAEIEGAVRMQVAGEFYETDSTSSSTSSASFANSYKMKLEQKKAARQQPQQPRAGVGATTAVVPPAVQSPAKAMLSTPAQPAPVSIVEPPKKLDTPSYQPKPGVVSSPPPTQTEVGISTAAPPRPVTTFAAPPAVAMNDEENVRRSIRTLQGLLLKHRGGPGFGAGRLRAPEAQRLEDTLQNVKSLLRAEVDGTSVTLPSTSDSVTASVAKVVARPIAAMPPPTQTVPSMSTPARSAIPPPAASTVTPSMTNDPLAGSVACVEAVLKMYKESTPAEREAMIIPLREAFMAAASASNKYIAESELSAHRAAMEAGSVSAFASIENNPPSLPIMGFPTTYDVTNPQETDEDMIMTSTGDIMATNNDKKLEDVYNALLRARGDGGKLGLKNISGDEANDLAEKLVMMRGVLLDELNK